ncbi:MAG TPA: aminopeptidase [Thermoplasmata archaeon]|nr:aminopeptidase [Thermoplasmata archaeon]
MQGTSGSPEGVEQLARTVIGKTLGLKRGETVLIEAWSNSLPYAEAFQREARRVGAKPIVLFESEPVYWETVEAGRGKDLGVPPRSEWAALEAADAYVYFWGPSDRTRVRALPPKAQQQLTAYNGRWYDVAAKKGIRGARIELALAEPGNASAYGVDLDAWRAELIAASTADPKQMQRAGARLRPSLEGGKRLRITHPNGTDLTLGLKKGRKLIVDDGQVDAADVRAKRNMVNVPGGSAVVAVDESVADGVIIGNQVSRFDQMRKRLGEPRWEFKDGRLVSLSASEGGQEFSESYRKAPKGKERPGMFEIGLNPDIRIAPTFEDQEAGAVTLYLGGNKAYGGSSSVPYFAYLVLRGATVQVDGKTLVQDGKLA